MKKIFSVLTASLLCSMLSVTTAACSTDGPDTPDKPDVPSPTPPEQPEVKPPVAGVEQDIKEYFRQVLAGEQAEMPEVDELSVENPDEAAAKVWELWKQAYAESAEPKLPSPSDMHADYSTGSGYQPAGNMTLSNGEDMRYYLGFKGEKPAQGWPLFISLHGSGESAAKEWKMTVDWDEYYSDDPSLFLVPMSPKGGTGCRWYQPSRQQAWERVLRMAYTSGVVDPDRIYFQGISEGAYGSQRLAGFYADYLAGVGPVAGGEPLYTMAPENTANIYYCARTGELDTMYGRLLCTRQAKKRWDELAEAHPGYYEHYIHIMPAAGHDLYNGSDYGFDGITAKLKEHSRNAQPKYVYWENYALGGINGEGIACRKAFYNLRPLEAQNGCTDGPERDAYEMKIEGNAVTLNVSSVTVMPAEPASGDGWTMNVGCTRSSVPATKGKVRIYLSKELVDLSAPVTVTVNGTKAFEGMTEPSAEVMVETAALLFDPTRVFTAAIDVEVK